MAELLKKTEAEAEHLEKEAAQLGKGAMQNKMKIVGAIASGLSICMSPIFRKLLEICPVIREIGSSRRLRSSTARCGWHTDFSESIANGRLFSRTSRESSLV